MRNILHTKLMYPEPEQTGGGEEPVVDTDNAAETPKEEPKEYNNPYAAALDGEPVEEQETPEQTDAEPDWTVVDELGLDDNEREIFTAAAKNSNTTPEQAVAFMRDIKQGVAERQARMKQAEDAALKKEWGADFDKKLASTSAFIKRVAQFAGWTPEEVKSLSTAKAFRLFDTLNSYVNGGKVVTSAKTPAPNKPKDLRSLKKEAAKLTGDFYAARRANNQKEAERIADEHYKLSQQIYGSEVGRMLVWS